MMRTPYVKILSCLMLVIFPGALFAADQPAAMLYSHGTALLNGNSIPRSSAIFSGDLVQTNKDSVANINATGSTVLVLNDSLVQYEGSAVKLEHGGVTHIDIEIAGDSSWRRHRVTDRECLDRI